MEPEIKPAAQFTKTGTVGVLATAGTLKSEKYLKHKEKYASDIRIIEHVGDGFVELVEKGIISGPEAESIVRKSLEPLLDAGADTIVLGCTHYPFLSDVIIGLAGPEIRLIDPAPAIAKHLIEVMDEEGITYGSADSKSSHIDLRTSGDPDILEKIFRQL